VNEKSLAESNALLEAASKRTEPGEVIEATPAELAVEAGIDNRLSIARAVRALMSRGRIAQEGSGYRLLESRPLEAGEPASVHRPIRRRRRKDDDGQVAPEPEGPPTYDELGRTLIDRLIELNAEVAELRSAVERARNEAEAARREAVEVARSAAADRRRAEGREDEVTTLRRQLEMTESNLRTVIEAARNRPSSPLEDTDAQAILDILSSKGAPSE
jgi:HAMP domain-containing protein